MSYRDSFDRQAYAKGVEKGKSLIDESALATIAELLSKPRSNLLVKISSKIAVRTSFVIRVEKEDSCVFVFTEDGKHFKVNPAEGVTVDELFDTIVDQLTF